MTMLSDRSSESDEDGYYEVRGVRRGAKYRVAVDHADFASAQSDAIEVIEESVEVNVTLTVGSAISGHVLSAEGTPMPVHHHRCTAR